MKREFWLLDLNYETHDGKPSIWMWGITRDDKRLLVIQEYEPYFYILPRKGQNAHLLSEKLATEKPEGVARAALEKRKLLAKDVDVVKVFSGDVDSLGKLARLTVKLLGAEAAFENDLRFATKFQNEFAVRPCQWYEVEGDPSSIDPPEFSVDEVVVAKNPLTAAPRDENPRLRLFAFTALVASQVGSPNAERDPISALAWSESRTYGLLELGSTSERKIVEGFASKIAEANPDVVFSFEGNSFAWPYLLKRARRNGVEFGVGRDNGPPRQSLHGHFSLTGRENVDLSDFARDLYDVKEKTLENVVRYLGVESERPVTIDENEYHVYWSKLENRKVLLETLRAQSKMVLDLGSDALNYVTQLSYLSGLPPDQVLAAAVGFRVDNYMMMEAHRLGQLIPPRNEQPVIPYKGAIVLKPELGIHENVAVLDFSSMYPSLMIKYNISPDTFVGDKSVPDTYIIPEVGSRFRKKPPGFYTIVLSSLIETRRQVKKELSALEKGTAKYRILRARERATKIITNAVYGYAGWAGARWYAREVAESAAALGRDTVKRSISIAKRSGLRVLYGDTDSLFVHFDKKTVDEFLKAIETELGLDISLSQTYKRILFTEAMKKYAGLRENGDIDVVGMEAIRGDWSQLAKDVQNRVLKDALEDKGPSRAIVYVSGLVKDLKSASLPVSSLVIWKTLTKRPEQYEVHAPHVEAAKKLVSQGWSISPGDRVGFVIVKGPGKLFQKAEPYFRVRADQIDYDYYVQNQVLPVAARALSVFGISEKDILRGGDVQGRL